MLQFPPAASPKVQETDSAAREKRLIEVHALCQSTTQAMAELRHGVQNVIFEVLDMLNLDAKALQFLTGEGPRTVEALMRKEVDGLGTATLVRILEAMHPVRES
jgi:hypothetical protein